MLVSCVVALYIPFELFLFAYAVLGPADYRTGIAWLHKLGYFTRGEQDYWLLGGLAAALFLTAVWTGQDISQQQPISTASFTFLALGSALVLVLTDKLVPRLLGLAAVAALSFSALITIRLMVVLIPQYLPPQVHA